MAIAIQLVPPLASPKAPADTTYPATSPTQEGSLSCLATTSRTTPMTMMKSEAMRLMTPLSEKIIPQMCSALQQRPGGFFSSSSSWRKVWSSSYNTALSSSFSRVS